MAGMQQDMGVAINSLKSQLEGAGISTSEWGRGSAKTLRHLVQEIQSGETSLITTDNGQPLRNVVVGNAYVYYQSPDGQQYKLLEEKQIFTDGRERRRNLGHSVSEKMKSSEVPLEAMIRGVQEELGIKSEIKIAAIGSEEESINSPSYPGLISRYVQHKFRVDLTDEQFKPEGYIEVQEDKSTYFIWEKLNS